MLPLIPVLERFLRKVLHKKIRTVAQPRYLHKVTIELSDTVIEAVRNETLHLYDNAFEIIIRGLRLRPDDVRSEVSLQTIIKGRDWQPIIDVDRQYNLTIKALYSGIIEYISQALPEMTPEQANKLFSIRAAGREIVEAVKDTKHLQKNLANYANSPNQYLRQEYDQLRLALAALLRELEHVRQQKPGESMILALDNLRLNMRKSDKELNIRLEAAIREKKITPQQATSIMNDSNYIYEVTDNLVRMGEVLFSTESEEIQSTERLLKLEEDELETLVAKKSQ
ncbi:MAG: hypothetical protein CSA42_07815 [Gammaproteobacteria bacterium]|nr:MAG: hypothetical protein CSA42_07815 [Gammaproteobacteria bacterium]